MQDVHHCRSPCGFCCCCCCCCCCVLGSSRRGTPGEEARQRVLSALVAALDRLGDVLDAPQPGVPGSTDRRQLRGSATELGVVDPVPLLAAYWSSSYEGSALQDNEVLGDTLSGHGQLLTQVRGGAVAGGEQQIEDPAPRRVADRRPEVVVDGRGGCAHDRLSNVAT